MDGNDFHSWWNAERREAAAAIRDHFFTGALFGSLATSLVWFVLMLAGSRPGA